MYKHIFFDFDGTLWDIQGNSKLTIFDIIARFNLPVEDPHAFFNRFDHHNHRVWQEYQQDQLSKSTLRTIRFERLFSEFDFDPSPINDIAQFYIENCPYRNQLIAGAEALLQTLSGHFHLHVLTNGFGEIQPVKLNSTGLDKYFENLITPAQSQYKKPHSGMFEFARNLTGAHPEESLMIGDDYRIDIIGAQHAGWDQVLFDPSGNFELQQGEIAPTHTVRHLSEIPQLIQ